jgi:hypothetical protein
MKEPNQFLESSLSVDTSISTLLSHFIMKQKLEDLEENIMGV